MHDDPLRAQSLSLLAGSVLAVIGVAACAILAFARPQGTLGTAPIVMARESGALYVRVDDTLHSVQNLASARLIARSAATPTLVGEAAIAKARRGPSMGIPGAPATIGAPLAAPSWTVCDTDRTVVLVGADPAATDRLDGSRSVLATPRGEGPAATYLLYDGLAAPKWTCAARRWCAPCVWKALHRSRFRERSSILCPKFLRSRAPPIADVGAPGPPSLPGIPVGAVVRVTRAESTDHYAVLRDGVQRIGEVAADLIRFTYPGGFGDVPSVAPSTIARTRIVQALSVDDLPQRARQPVGADGPGAVCVHWQSDQAGRAHSAVLTGEMPVAGRPVGKPRAGRRRRSQPRCRGRTGGPLHRRPGVGDRRGRSARRGRAISSTISGCCMAFTTTRPRRTSAWRARRLPHRGPSSRPCHGVRN